MPFISGVQVIKDSNGVPVATGTVALKLGAGIGHTETQNGATTDVEITAMGTGSSDVTVRWATHESTEPAIRFAGTGVVVTQSPEVESVVTIDRPLIRSEGVAQTSRAGVDYRGQGVSIVDDESGDNTRVVVLSGVVTCKAACLTNIANLASWYPATTPADGVTAFSSGEIVLCTGQTTVAHNGPYVVGGSGSALTLTRPSWWASSTTVPTGTLFRTAEGTAYRGSLWQAAHAADSITVDVNDPQFLPLPQTFAAYSIPVASVGPSGTDYFDLGTRDFRCGNQAFAVAQSAGVYHYTGRHYDVVAVGAVTANEAYSLGWLTNRTGTGEGNLLGIYAGNAPAGADANGGSLALFSGDPDGSNYFGTIEFHIGRAAGRMAGYMDEFGLTLTGVSALTVESLGSAAAQPLRVDAAGKVFAQTTQTISNTTAALTSTASVVFANNSSDTVTINLPAPGTNAGRTFQVFIEYSALTHNVVLHRNGTEKIDTVAGDKTISLASTKWLMVGCDGTDWFTNA